VSSGISSKSLSEDAKPFNGHISSPKLSWPETESNPISVSEALAHLKDLRLGALEGRGRGAILSIGAMLPKDMAEIKIEKSGKLQTSVSKAIVFLCHPYCS